MDDTIDFSALDVLSSSSTPRLLQKNKLDKLNDTRSHQDDRLNEQHITPVAEENDESDYSMHLSALGGRSASSTLNIDREILKVESDDIGGPSDFTLNLAEYINGVKQVDIHGTTISPIRQQEQQQVVGEHCTPVALKILPQQNDATQASVDQPVESSECLATLLPHPDEDLRQTIAELQSRCDNLQRQNQELSRQLLDIQVKKVHDNAMDLQEKLNTERKLRESEQEDAEQARIAMERDLQVEKQRSEAFQTKMSELQIAQAQSEVQAELAHQDMMAQISAWKNRADESQQRVQALQSRKQDPDAESTSKLKLLEDQLSTQEEKHKAEVNAIREEYEGVAKEMDEWIFDKVKQKEDHYTAVDLERQTEISKLKIRNKQLEDLYARCGKELMLSWGREEFGPPKAGERQKYRYQRV